MTRTRTNRPPGDPQIVLQIIRAADTILFLDGVVSGQIKPAMGVAQRDEAGDDAGGGVLGTRRAGIEDVSQCLGLLACEEGRRHEHGGKGEGKERAMTAGRRGLAAGLATSWDRRLMAGADSRANQISGSFFAHRVRLRT